MCRVYSKAADAAGGCLPCHPGGNCRRLVVAARGGREQSQRSCPNRSRAHGAGGTGGGPRAQPVRVEQSGSVPGPGVCGGRGCCTPGDGASERADWGGRGGAAAGSERCAPGANVPGGGVGALPLRGPGRRDSPSGVRYRVCVYAVSSLHASPRIVKEESFLDNGTLVAAFVPEYLANKLGPMLQRSSD